MTRAAAVTHVSEDETDNETPRFLNTRDIISHASVDDPNTGTAGDHYTFIRKKEEERKEHLFTENHTYTNRDRIKDYRQTIPTYTQ